MIAITTHQLHLLHHTLGLDERRREPWRNYFMAGDGHHDQPDLEALEAAGLMRRGRTPSFCDDGDVLFICTDAGKDYAIEQLPAPRKRTRYQQFMDDDYGHSFAEWLGIDLPRVESNYRYGKDCRWRYVRRDYCSITVAGEWAPTKKAAKASYKAALAAHRGSAATC